MPERKTKVVTDGIPGPAPADARHGLTLLELVVVIAILVVLAGFIIPLAGGQIEKSKITATQANLVLIRDAIMGTTDKPGFYSDTGLFPSSLKDLFDNPFQSLPSTDPNYPLATFNRDTGRGWHGPYLIPSGSTYSNTDFLPYYSPGDPGILDAWGHPIVIQVPNLTSYTGTAYSNANAANLAFIRLISAGRDGVIQTQQGAIDAHGNPYPIADNRGDDLVLFINHADSDQ